MSINKEEQKLIDAVSTARDHGDLKENAEYHAAREELALYRSRKQADEQALKAAVNAEKENTEGKSSAVQELLDSGMTEDQIRATMPWMLE